MNEKEKQKEYLTKPVIAEYLKKWEKEKEEEEKERARLEETHKKEQERLKKIELEKRKKACEERNEKLKREEEERNKEARKKKKIYIFVAALLIVLLTICIWVSVFNKKKRDENQYQEALALFEQKKYAESEDILKQIKDYKDSKSILVKIRQEENRKCFISPDSDLAYELSYYMGYLNMEYKFVKEDSDINFDELKMIQGDDKEEIYLIPGINFGTFDNLRLVFKDKKLTELKMVDKIILGNVTSAQNQYYIDLISDTFCVQTFDNYSWRYRWELKSLYYTNIELEHTYDDQYILSIQQ